ncbi:hypothetical protein OG2516_15254 [Oceanicola granulosus HTCC2516]|uniref:VWFA domain-containing protein n=1 Tax=Oceanicola granulosus (strain ATCC BAA-861 / DSM 15982 / KCTC 12143 / HTCC2516) TaxID=314256 RepID=Q2CFG2_OCEGH|nr:DUF1194 domain-containing protein [Oceanicola granulosus]EAR51333.1 hypothetical protein OG2516_15254 [Oceanicola granulosus HTCC2516]
MVPLLSLALALALLAAPARACDTALLLLMDVSNSIDVGEYRLQTDGLADALEDPEIAQAMLEGQVALSVVQWSGPDDQAVSLPWTRMRTPADLAAFAARARAMRRAFRLSDTAPAEALTFALAHMAQAPPCARRIVDISGDGMANAGGEVRGLPARAERQQVTINGLAIEGMGVAVTTFYRRALITRDGFVITARGHREYPEAIRRKILREVSRIFGKAR